MSSTETWKEVIGTEGLYQISNLGRLKSFHPGRAIENGRFRNITKGRERWPNGRLK